MREWTFRLLAVVFASVLLAGGTVAAADKAGPSVKPAPAAETEPANPSGGVQRIERAFVEAMNKGATTKEMLEAAAARHAELKTALGSARSSMMRQLGEDPGVAAALSALDADFARLEKAIMDREMAAGGTLAPVSATIAGGNLLSAQISLYLELRNSGIAADGNGVDSPD